MMIAIYMRLDPIILWGIILSGHFFAQDILLSRAKGPQSPQITIRSDKEFMA
jgi:hypothetical protein